MPEYAESVQGLEGTEGLLEYISKVLGRCREQLDYVRDSLDRMEVNVDRQERSIKIMSDTLDFHNRVWELGYNPSNLPKA